MCLINVYTLELEEYFERDIPPYAILSHRWRSEELTFKEVSKNRADVSKKGYTKLVKAAEVASEYDVNYLWIDTCCIDKRSSAELSEAINSMFSWYENAEICLAYLEDTKAGPEWEHNFRSSVWFSRSWTLQELIAPKHLDFYDGDWALLGSRAFHKSILGDVTGIRGSVLEHKRPPRTCSVAERMFWASKRKATRSEDIAYSLLGIFGINIPLLYGEGSKSFARLQEEIIRGTSETTFLCWGIKNPETRLLASSPVDYRESGTMWPHYGSRLATINLTNIGLEITARVFRWDMGTYAMFVGEYSGWEYVLLLRKSLRLPGGLYRAGLERISSTSYKWEKVRKLTIFRGNEEQELEDMMDEWDDQPVTYGFDILTQPLLPITPTKLIYGDYWSEREVQWAAAKGSTELSCSFVDPAKPCVAQFNLRSGQDLDITIHFSFDFDFRPCVLVHRQGQERLRLLTDISDSTAEPNEKIEDGYSPIEYRMAEVREPREGHVSYFLRSEMHDMFARVPTELVSGVDPIWVCLVPPWRRKITSQTWALVITGSRPRLRVQTLIDDEKWDV